MGLAMPIIAGISALVSAVTGAVGAHKAGAMQDKADQQVQQTQSALNSQGAGSLSSTGGRFGGFDTGIANSGLGGAGTGHPPLTSNLSGSTGAALANRNRLGLSPI